MLHATCLFCTIYCYCDFRFNGITRLLKELFSERSGTICFGKKFRNFMELSNWSDGTEQLWLGVIYRKLIMRLTQKIFKILTHVFSEKLWASWKQSDRYVVSERVMFNVPPDTYCVILGMRSRYGRVARCGGKVWGKNKKQHPSTDTHRRHIVFIDTMNILVERPHCPVEFTPCTRLYRIHESAAPYRNPKCRRPPHLEFLDPHGDYGRCEALPARSGWHFTAPCKVTSRSINPKWSRGLFPKLKMAAVRHFECAMTSHAATHFELFLRFRVAVHLSFKTQRLVLRTTDRFANLFIYAKRQT